MKCRRLKKVGNTNHLVWFGSYGKNDDGTAKFYNPDDKHDNYADLQQGLCDDLVQRLSIIQTELFYAVEYGIPLFNKITKKAEIDIEVLDIIDSHPEVYSIMDFSSEIRGRTYSAQAVIQSAYGVTTMTI